MGQSIEELRAAYRSATLTGQSNYLPVGEHYLKVKRLFFKSPGENSPLGLFISEFKVVESSSPSVAKDLDYSETFEPAPNSGWEKRLSTFILATLGQDWRQPAPEARELDADIRFNLQSTLSGFEAERDRIHKKYGHPAENFLVDRIVRAVGSPYRTKKSGKDIVKLQWSVAA